MTRGLQQRKIWIVFTWRHGVMAATLVNQVNPVGMNSFLYSPLMHLVCPQNFAFALFPISLGTAVIPRRNRKQSLCKICGVEGKGNKVYYGRCANGEL